MGGRISGGLAVEGVERCQEPCDEPLAGPSQSHFAKAEGNKAACDETDDDEAGECRGHMEWSPGVRGEAERHEPARKSASVKSQRAAEPNECGLRCGRRDHESVEL